MTNEKRAAAKLAAAEALPEVDWTEVRQQAWQTTLKATVLVTGLTAKAADTTASLSRRVQVEAAKRIHRVTPMLEPAEKVGRSPEGATVDNSPDAQ
jgi:hypothetical protein